MNQDFALFSMGILNENILDYTIYFHELINVNEI